MSKRLLCILTVCLLAFTAACQPEQPVDDGWYQHDYTAEHTSDSRFIHFASSDSALDSFLNEFAERHMRDTEERIHTHPVGAGSSAWKEWESMVGSWWDASDTNGTMSYFYATNRWVSSWLLNPAQDDQGYIWADDGNALNSWGMGWEFPNYNHGGIAYDFTAGTEGWTAGSGVNMSVANSNLIASGSNVSEISITSPNMGINALFTPFLKMSFTYTSISGTVDDLYVYYQTGDDTDFSEEKKVSFSEFATTGFSTSDFTAKRGYFFPMYLQEGWGQSRSSNPINKIKLVLKAEAGTTISGKFNLDYLNTEYDDRQAINNANYIIAAKNLLEFSQDKEFLAKVLPKARKAMNFMLNTLDGESGLISTEYFVGHSNDGNKAPGTGIGSGYWDVLAFPNVNIYCNISYYNALNAMAYLENMATNYDITTPAVTTVNSQLDGFDTYTKTAAQLEALAQVCKGRFQTEFWNEATGRFHAGTRQTYNTIQDNGYLMFNQQAIAAGLATDAQKQSILSWINGERIIATDNSKGDDIYYYEFAPRFNTKGIGTDFYWGYSSSFDGNVQDGGTAMHLAYYDIVAQASGNPERAFERVKTLQAWYEKVAAAGGAGQEFYRKYYNGTIIKLQGGGPGGTIGLDYEFLEAALMFSSVKEAYFGLSAGFDNTLELTPYLPDGLTYWRLENLVFSGRYYDAAIGKFFTEISGVDAYTAGTTPTNAKLRVAMDVPLFNYEVRVNGTPTDAYTVSGGKVIVELPFGNARVEIVKVAS